MMGLVRRKGLNHFTRGKAVSWLLPVIVLGASATASELVSINSGGEQANQFSTANAVSEDGSKVLFVSTATNLVETDDKALQDLFLHDAQTALTTQINISDIGETANADSAASQISDDGRFVVFQSAASNLVDGDYNDVADIFLRDLDLDTISRINISSYSEEADSYSYHPSISNDGRYIVYSSTATNLVDGDNNSAMDVFLYDQELATTSLISRNLLGQPATGDSFGPTISADGSTIAFSSVASDLVDSDSNDASHIYAFKPATGTMSLVSVNSTGELANDDSALYSKIALSGDGSVITFDSSASNLVSGDDNEQDDVFAHRLDSKTTQLISATQSGHSGNGASIDPTISRDGRYIAFLTYAGDLENANAKQAATDIPSKVLVHDLKTTNVTTLSGGYDFFYRPLISADGSQVIYSHGEISAQDGLQMIDRQVVKSAVEFEENLVIMTAVSFSASKTSSNADGSVNYAATLNNTGSAISQSLALTIDIHGFEQMNAVDGRCQGNWQLGVFECELEGLDAGETQLEFSFVEAANLTIQAKLKGSTGVLTDQEVRASSGGGALAAWLLIPLAASRRFRLR